MPTSHRKLSLALVRALKAQPSRPEDAAAVELARAYARQIDANEMGLLNVYGRGFRETLETLGMTPRARATLLKDAKPEVPRDAPLDELRARRAKVS